MTAKKTVPLAGKGLIETDSFVTLEQARELGRRLVDVEEKAENCCNDHATVSSLSTNQYRLMSNLNRLYDLQNSFHNYVVWRRAVKALHRHMLESAAVTIAIIFLGDVLPFFLLPDGYETVYYICCACIGIICGCYLGRRLADEHELKEEAKKHAYDGKEWIHTYAEASERELQAGWKDLISLDGKYHGD
jgi:hypothetical protein